MSTDMRMIEVKTADLIGPALRYAVAKAIGLHIRHQQRDGVRAGGYYAVGNAYGYMWTDTKPNGYAFSQYGWSPDCNWLDGGRLIDRHDILFSRLPMTGELVAHFGEVDAIGDTRLIAACRALVKADSGDVVSVPAELLEAA